jgi:triosephosphate isomerase
MIQKRREFIPVVFCLRDTISHMKKTVPLVVGNWKLNPVTLNDAVNLASQVATRNKKVTEPYIAIAPSFVYLNEVGKKINKGPVALVAQDVYYKNIGAHTGEISVLQLKDLGVEMVIIGHSERRAMGETDQEVLDKVLLSLKHRLVPIVCVGERERDDQGHFFNFVESQLRKLANGLTTAQMKKLVLAYEPIWAIGTGNTATKEDVKEMQLFIESVLAKIYDRKLAKAVRLIYGGSVKPNNAKELHEEGGMNGFLVGGASLKAGDFTEIIKAVQ